MPKDNEESQVFSAEYVKELRTENANWRTKYRELEARQSENDIKMELLSRGINAEAKWINQEKGQSIEQAVDSFLEKYPQFNQQEVDSDSVKVQEPKINPPRPMSVPQKKGPNTSGPKPLNGRLGNKTLEEIKKDPSSRAALRQQYRALLHASGHQNYTGE